MLQYFIIWAKEKLNVVQAYGSFAAITMSEPNSNPSARLDIETDMAIARITFWDSGDMSAEVLDVESEQTIYYLNGNVSNFNEMDVTFRPFFNALNLLTIQHD